MTPKTIHIIPSIYSIEVTTHSNNHILKMYCYDCLARSKTNHEYKDYQPYPAISNVRVCCNCHAMTIQAVIQTFNITKQLILQLAEESRQYQLPDDTLTPTFIIDSLYLDILKKEMKNGEKRQRYPHSRH